MHKLSNFRLNIDRIFLLTYTGMICQNIKKVKEGNDELRCSILHCQDIEFIKIRFCLYARYLCSRDALGQARRATIGYLVYNGFV